PAVQAGQRDGYNGVVCGCGAHRRFGQRRGRPRRGAADQHRGAGRRGRHVSDWQRLSPRMLLVHPVHEALRQLPVLVGSLVLGSATGNSAWPLAALGATVGIGLLRWFFTTYRIDDENVALRTGVLRRRSMSVPRNRIRSVQTDSRLLHRVLGLTVLRVGTG